MSGSHSPAQNMCQTVVLTVPDNHLEVVQLADQLDDLELEEQEDEAVQVREQTVDDKHHVGSESQEFEDRPKSYTELVDGVLHVVLQVTHPVYPFSSSYFFSLQ